MASAVHNILITLHAFGGIVCFITGCIVLMPPVQQRAGRRWLFNLFLGSLALMLVPLLLVIAIDLGAPGWLVVVIALLGIAGGIWGISIAKSKAL